MTDLEALQLVKAVTARPGLTSAMGTRVVSAKPGEVVLALDRRGDLLQIQGHFHGGVISALADHAAGGAVTTAMPAGRFAVTVDLHVNFLSPAKGDLLLARAKAIHVGGIIGVAHVDVISGLGASERICAVATATLRAVEIPADPAAVQPGT